MANHEIEAAFAKGVDQGLSTAISIAETVGANPKVQQAGSWLVVLALLAFAFKVLRIGH